MTLAEILAAKAEGKQVQYQGRPVTILKASLQMVYVTTGEQGAGPIQVTPDQLSPLP